MTAVAGKLIVIEGIDGSGKSTQYKMLCERLESGGREFKKLVFPRYDNESSALIRMYLGGAFGSDPSDVNAYAASSFYSADRYASWVTDWGEYYRGGGLVLSDRYTTSNAVHQGAKLSRAARAGYFDWLDDFEFARLGLPRPDVVIYLSVDVDTALRQMAERSERTGAKRDIHETHAGYLRLCAASGLEAAEHFGWRVVGCVRDGRMRSPEDIHAEIFSAVNAAIDG